MAQSPKYPRVLDNLVIVDRHEKVSSLASALISVGLKDFEIFVIGSELYSYPKSTFYSGLDKSFNEIGRFVSNQILVDHLQSWARLASRVLIALDADMMGDSLALDIAGLLTSHSNVGRARIRALDVESIGAAFSNIEPVRTKDGWPHQTNRILDRLIQCVFAVRGAKIEAVVPVSRYVSPVLGLTSRKALNVAEVTLALPAADGRDPFVHRFEVSNETRSLAEDLLGRSEEFVKQGKTLAVGSSRPAPKNSPWGFGLALLNISKLTGRSIFEVARSLSNLYERGLASYPISEESLISAEGVAILIEISNSNGLRFDPSRLGVFMRTGRHAHEAVRPLISDINISKPMGLSEPDIYVLSLITRNLLSCGLPFSLSSPDAAELPDWAKGLKFSRTICQRSRNWAAKPTVSNLRVMPVEEVLLKEMMRSGVVNPIKWIHTLITIIENGLIDSRGQLTQRGEEWLNAAPEQMLNADLAKKIDNFINESADKNQQSESPNASIRRIVERLGLSDGVLSILELREHESN